MKRLIKKADLKIEQGDYVDFGAYGKLYICNPEYKEDWLWVTDVKEDRNNPKAKGWSIEKNKAKEIIEKL